MENNLPEVVFSSADKAGSQRISRYARSGRLRKLCPRIYTPNFSDSDEVIFKRNLYPILGSLFPDAIISHRSALEGGLTGESRIFLTYSYSRKRCFPGVTVHLLKGPPPDESDSRFGPGLYISSQPRAFLENLQVSRSSQGSSKTLPRSALEDMLDQICRIKGEQSLNELRDKARQAARKLGFTDEFARLSAMISAILRTQSAKNLSSPAAQARAADLPYDPARLPLFSKLISALIKTPLPERKEREISPAQTSLLAFFESYFSNYIEGTEFEIEEAFDIVFNHKLPAQRPADAHDILGTYTIAGNVEKRSGIAETHNEFMRQLSEWHFTMLAGRPELNPGQLKMQANRAGQTHFVIPDLVRGTLKQGFELKTALPPGLPRAIFMMFLVSEVHPFLDGNGRIARLIMNAELSHERQCRILIPTVLRNDYLMALRALSRTESPEPLIKVLDLAQQFSTQVPLDTFENASKMLTRSNAFMEPDEGRLAMPNG